MPPLSEPDPKLTVEQYEDRLAEGDRWIEIVAGRLVRLDPPDEQHGDVVRNLSRPLANLVKTLPTTYACFELPLVLSRDPATVRCPAISCFDSGDRFAESDNLVSESRPALVIEVASTNDRREGMSERVKGYLNAGIRCVWVIDPVTRHVHQFEPPAAGRMLKETQMLSGGSVLPGFQLLVAELFQRPKWDRS
jgi:Uma2 family endonuclease